MEQNIQEKVQQNSLPIKTKIAAWWMIGIGALFICYAIFSLFAPGDQSVNFLVGMLSFILGVPPLVVGIIFLKTKKKLVWFLSFAINLICLLFLLPEIVSYMRDYYWISILLLVLFAPIYLLLSDRKNFWKVAR